MKIIVRKAVFIFALLLLVCSSAWATGKITVDPSASDQVSIQQWESDARLSQKVTYDARHKAVKNILADLSDMTGVTLNSGYNKQDWQVRDRKMNVFAKDITLADLMSSIARTMKFKWSINKDITPWAYRIYMDRKTLAVANAELSKAQKDFDEEITRRRQAFADMIDNWDDDQIADDDEDNPYLAKLHKFGIGAAVKGLFNDIPNLRDSFINKEYDMGYYPISKLSSETQQLVLNAVKQRYEIQGYSSGGNGFTEDIEKAFTTGGMLLDVVPDELGWKANEYRKFAGIGLYINDIFFQLDPLLGDPSSPLNQCRAQVDLQAYEKNIPLKDSWAQSESAWQTAAIGESKKLEESFPTEPQPDIPDEPDLHNKIVVKPEEKEWLGLVDFEAAVAQASGLAVVSDSFKVTFGSAAVGKSEMELKDVMKHICEGYRYNWEKHGDIIEMSSKEWFKKRATQIPDEWVEKWLANLKKRGYMSIDDYAQIAMLTTAQLFENIETNESFYKAEIFDSAHATQIWLLRLYASLSAEQKKAMYSDMGLVSMTFSPDQWVLLRNIYTEPWFKSDGVSAIFKCSVADDERKIPAYTFRLFNAKTGNEMLNWPVKMLEYKEPAKPESETPKAQEKKSENTAQPATGSQTKTK